MQRPVSVGGVVLGMVVALVAGGAGAGCTPGAKTSKDGKVLYETTCVQCHGADGRGVDVWKTRLGVPDLTDAALHARLDDAAIHDVIKNGSKSRKMPPWGGVYSDEQIDALVAYVRGFKP